MKRNIIKKAVCAFLVVMTALSMVPITALASSAESPVMPTDTVYETIVRGMDTSISIDAGLPESGGRLSYQWYVRSGSSWVKAGSSTDTLQIESELMNVGVEYYYKVVVTNTVGVGNTASAERQYVLKPIAYGSVAPAVKPVAPVLSHDLSKEYTVNQSSSLTLSIAVEHQPTVSFSYQWYMVTGAGSIRLAGAKNSSYSVPTSSSGTASYYCEVTASNRMGNASTKSTQTTVHIEALDPSVVTISSQPQNVTVPVNSNAALSVGAYATGDQTWLTYQWYSCSDVNGGGAMPVYYNGSASASLSVPTDKPGVYYYYCTVTCFGDSKNSAVATVTVSESDYVFPFTDVSQSDWFYLDVMSANKNNLIDGLTPSLFAPEQELTVAQAIKLASCMHQLDTKGEITLSNGSRYWYQPYVDYAIQNGIIPDESEYYGHYDEPVTRSQFVIIFYNSLPADRYTTINPISDGAIPDVSMGDNGASAIYKFYRAGILTGSGDPETMHYFLPDTSIKRSEVAAIMTRMFDAEARKSFAI